MVVVVVKGSSNDSNSGGIVDTVMSAVAVATLVSSSVTMQMLMT